jgi:diacylglycerol kinase (ATP)
MTSEWRQSPRRLRVIYNPTAGFRRRRKLAALLLALDRLGAKVTLAETRGRGHAIELAQEAADAGCDAVVAAGGDGTINEVANGLWGTSVPLALLPLGTANVLAAELDLPRSAERLAELAAFAPARTVWPGEIVEDGVARGRIFLLMAGVGFDAAVIAHVDPALKRRFGKAAFVASSLMRILRYELTRYPARIDGMPYECASLVAARAHFYGGRFVLAPQASLDERRLDVVLFEKSGPVAAFAYSAAMVLGTLQRRSDLRVIEAKEVELPGPAGALVQLDGDICATLPARIRLADAPLQLIGGGAPHPDPLPQGEREKEAV